MIRVAKLRYSTRLTPRRISSAYGWRMERARMNYSIGRIGAAIGQKAHGYTAGGIVPHSGQRPGVERRS